MADTLELFKDLSKFYNRWLKLEDIEKIYEEATESSDAEDEDFDGISDEDDDDDDSDNETNNIEIQLEKLHRKINNRIEKIPMVKMAMKNSQVLSVLQELCTMIRNIRDSNNGYDNTYDSWDRVIEISPKNQYFAFIFSLLRLINYKPIKKQYRKLALSAASLYILSLTIPGSKQYHIFDEMMINYVLEVFNLIDIIQNNDISKKINTQDRFEIWINFVNLCDDLKIMFRYVHFDEYKDARNSILWELNKVMFKLHVNGYENIYAANLHTKCFEIYDEIINAHNGDPEETLMKIMKLNYGLHVFPPIPPRRQENYGMIGNNTQIYEHISNWFVNIINKYPRIVSKVLKHYIECVITSPEKDWKSDQIQKALDYAAKYDSALYTKCNESILDYLSISIKSDDSQIRLNSVDLLIRMLHIESKVNWELFRHEISNIPREVYIIKELIIRLLDINNSIKLKIIHGLHSAYTKGTIDAIKIMKECTLYAIYNDNNIELPQEPKLRPNEIRYVRPTQPEPAYTFEGYELIETLFSQLPNTLYYLLRSSLAHIRRASIMLLESIVTINPLVIYNTNFVKEISKLGDDPSALVRKQALQMIDAVLESYINCYPVVFAWCKIIIPLFKDSDQKLVDFAWGCFKHRVFDNIKGIDNSNRAEHFMPWIILRVLLSTQPRQFLQHSISAAISRNAIDQRVLGLIESHIWTANSTEAWVLLSFVAGKIKSKEPDALISLFMKSALERSWNAGQNLQIILEVLAINIQDFSHIALNMAFSCIINLMKSGSIPPCLISKAFNLCLTISVQSETKKTSNNNRNKSQQKQQQQQQDSSTKKRSLEQLKWIEDIHKESELYLLENLKNFHSDRSKILSYLFSYTETNLELIEYPNIKIIKFIHKFLEAYLESESIESNEFEPDDMNTLNLMIILAARFSIRQSNVAETTCILFRRILKITERPTTVNNIIVAMTDLCKRHTQLIEYGLIEILNKLQSPYVEIRSITFKNLAQMILQDLIKLRGNLLLSLISTLLDNDIEMSNRATEFFLTYLEKKNTSLFHNCLLECPFVFNEYVYFEGFDSFAAAGKKIISPLKGDEKMKSRHSLYRIFMYELEEIILLMFFDNLRLIHAKVTKDHRINSKEGHAVIKDFFFIFKEICILSLEKREANNKNSLQQDQQQDETIDDAANAAAEEAARIQENNPVGASTSTAVAGSSNDIGKGRGRRNNAPTMNDAMTIVEKAIGFIPIISEIILKWNQTFEKFIQELTVAICMRFENFTEFAKPDNFWSKYRQIAKRKQFVGKKRRKRSHNNDDINNDSDNNNEDNEGENNEEIENGNKNKRRVQQTVQEKRPRTTMSILFEPFL